MEIETGKHFLFTGSEGLPLDHFEIVMEGALRRDPRRGDPVPRRRRGASSTIVEPHMYEVDDAVAKIDGYIVSVAGGGAHVGEKRLVRIVEAGRTAATAVLVDNGAPAAAEKKPARARAAKAEAARRRQRARRKKPAAAEKPARGDALAPQEGRAGRGRGAGSRRRQPAAAEVARGRARAAPAHAPQGGRRRRGRRAGGRASGPRRPRSAGADRDAEAPEGPAEGDAVESKPRRRGRRGGRRRSAAKAEATPAD